MFVSGLCQQKVSPRRKPRAAYMPSGVCPPIESIQLE